MDISRFVQAIAYPGYVTLVCGATARTARTILRREIATPETDADQAVQDLLDAAQHARENAWIRYFRSGSTTPAAIVQVEEADDPHNGSSDVPHALVTALVGTNSTLQTLVAHQADQLLRIVELTSDRMFDAGRAIGAGEVAADGPSSGLAGPAAILERVAERLIPSPSPTSPDQLWAMFQGLPAEQRQSWIEGILGVVERATGGGGGAE